MLEYSQREMSSFSTEDRRESSSNESIILDFSKLSHMTSSQYANHVCFRPNQSLRAKQKNKEEWGTHIGVNAVNASIWLYDYLYGKLVLSGH